MTVLHIKHYLLVSLGRLDTQNCFHFWKMSIAGKVARIEIDGINNAFNFRLGSWTDQTHLQTRPASLGNSILASLIKFSAWILSSTSDRNGCDDVTGCLKLSATGRPTFTFCRTPRVVTIVLNVFCDRIIHETNCIFFIHMSTTSKCIKRISLLLSSFTACSSFFRFTASEF